MTRGDALDDVDVALLEQQLADLAVSAEDAAEVLSRLAEAVFPGRVAMGDPARIMWPEPRRHEGEPAPAEGPREVLEAQIRKSEERFRSLVEQLPAVVFYAALGDEDNEVYVSPQIESLLGFTQEEWLTNPLLWYSQMHPDDHATVIEAFTKGVQTGTPFRAQVRFLSRDGEEVWILGEARLIRDEAERPAYFQGVAFDITMTKRAQEVIAQGERAKAEAAVQRAAAFAVNNARLRQLNRELQLAKEEAEAAALARSTFLTTMSHELRTPLNSVIVLAGLLAGEELTAAQQEMVRHMQLASDHLLELINDVLEFSRLRAGHVELDRRRFDVVAWLEDTMAILAPRAAEKGLRLRHVIRGPLPRWLQADQGRLRQVLLNLLGNAVKFTASGYVEVRLGAAQLGDGRWEYGCAVQDSGMGINPENAATLFDEFRQADSGIAREFGGTGLGLAICKHLCELLGGRIWVEQYDGSGSAGPGGHRHGATVAFTWTADAEDDSVFTPPPAHETVDWSSSPGSAIPTSASASGPAEPGNPVVLAPRGTASGLRILIAEDNLMNQQVALLLLAAMGYRADVVANGDDAIAAVRDTGYDVVLMDIAMPGTDGLSATRAIRTLGSEVHQPYIVALTAHAFPGDAETCLDAGMNDYVAKPIDRGQLGRALEAGAQQAATGRPTAPSPPARTGEDPTPQRSGDVGATSDFDPSLARDLLAEFGQGPVARLVEIFRSEATRLITVAAEAVSEGQIDQAEMAAHTLKSGAANLGARGMYANCVQLEALARAGSLEGAAALTAAMQEQLADALVLLDQILAAP